MADPSPHVFVSYASATTTGCRPGRGAGARRRPRRLDRAGIPGGANYGPEIVAAIRESAALVLCCSAAAFASRNVRQEVALAWKHERPILPLHLEPAAIPDDLAYWLEAAQWVEVLDRPEAGWLPEVVRGLGRPASRSSPSPATRGAEPPSGPAADPVHRAPRPRRGGAARSLGSLRPTAW